MVGSLFIDNQNYHEKYNDIQVFLRIACYSFNNKLFIHE
jgi:hypothetical protein